MILYFKGSDKALGVSFEDLYLSVALALAHGLLESVFLLLEAQASKTSFTNYVIVCFNGCFGWVPYNDHLTATSQDLNKGKKND